MIDLYFIIVMGVTLAWIHGFNYAFKPGEILGKPGEYMAKHWPKWLNKMTFDCPYCQSTLHGSTFFWIFLNDYPLILWPIFIVCLTGLSALFKD